MKECREAVNLMLEMQRTDDKVASKRGKTWDMAFLDMFFVVSNLNTYSCSHLHIYIYIR